MIPDFIIALNDIDFTTRAVYSLIYFFTENDKVCMATNSYFANRLHIDLKKVKRAIRELIDKKYIMTQKKNHDNKTRTIMRYDINTIRHYENGAFEGTGISFDYTK